MAYESNDKKIESVYSQRIRAGKRRTYFFDIRETRGNDYYLTITESRKRFNDDGYDRHKIFLYKEDFNKLIYPSWGKLNEHAVEITIASSHGVLESIYNFALGSVAGAIGASAVYPIGKI